MPREVTDRVDLLDELHNFLCQSNISARNVARLKILGGHEDPQVAARAALILEIARVLPGKRNRWLKLARSHRPLFDRLVDFVGVEFFEDYLGGHGNFESPLGRMLERYRIAPPWTACACSCGSDRSFRECCMERENDVADRAAAYSIPEPDMW